MGEGRKTESQHRDRQNAEKIKTTTDFERDARRVGKIETSKDRLRPEIDLHSQDQKEGAREGGE